MNVILNPRQQDFAKGEAIDTQIAVIIIFAGIPARRRAAGNGQKLRRQEARGSRARRGGRSKEVELSLRRQASSACCPF